MSMKLDSKQKKVIWAGILGNTLELYDYTIYAFFASILARQFFPSSDPVVSLMATYGVFATGFLLRPVGAVLLGAIGDLYGRKKALEISILLMAIPTLCIGILPTYTQVGILAPILLTIMRMLQGVSVGGELVGSYTYLIEHAHPSQKGFIGSMSLVGAFGGKWVGTLLVALMSLFLAESMIEEWGWRIPFIGGIVFAGMGYYLRKKVSETPVFKEMEQNKKVIKSPLKETFCHSKAAILKGIGCLVIHTSGVYLLFIYFPIYLKTVIGLSYMSSLLSNLMALTLCMIIMPLSGKLSDRIGKHPILFWGGFALTALLYPAFVIISQGNAAAAIAMQALLASVFAFMHGPLPTFLIDLFPAQIRYTATAITYNLGVGIFGGLTPIIATWLAGRYESPIAPCSWLIFCGLLSLISLAMTKEETFEPLRTPS